MIPSTARLPLSMVTLIFGCLSIPLAFLRHLCSLAVVLGLLAIAFYLWGRWKVRKSNTYSAESVRHSRIGGYSAMGGTLAAITMWVLWATNVLLR
jgi:tetrahydromethanopterin S-methyltransferase subunit C